MPFSFGAIFILNNYITLCDNVKRYVKNNYKITFCVAFSKNLWDTFSMNFAETLKKIREEKNLSQGKLAKRLNVAQSTVGMWESNKRAPRLGDINRIAKLLNITVSRLLDQPRDHKVEIIKNELYVDGDKMIGLDATDINRLLELAKALKKDNSTSPEIPPIKLESPQKKVLIIDDEEGMCKALYSLLVPHNYKVFLAFNGRMGLESFKELKPDIVLLDLNMPDIDGLEVLKIIRKTSNVPVIIITAHPEDVSEIHVADLKIEGYIEKPLNLLAVLNTLKHLIGE